MKNYYKAQRGGIYIDKLEKSILKEWLEIEYYTIASKAKFINKQVEVDHKLILKTIRCLDYMTTMKEKPSKEYIITVIALMWEYLFCGVKNRGGVKR